MWELGLDKRERLSGIANDTGRHLLRVINDQRLWLQVGHFYYPAQLVNINMYNAETKLEGVKPYACGLQMPTRVHRSPHALRFVEPRMPSET